MPANERLPRFQRRYQIHRPDAGRNERRDELVSAATPQSRPNPTQGIRPSSSSNFKASQKIAASSSAARLVSQTQRTLQYITVGSKAHAHALNTATFSLKHFRATKKIGMQVSAEKRLLIASKINADACE